MDDYAAGPFPIVSIALLRDGRRALSLALMWIALVLWVALAVAYASRAVRMPQGLRAEASQPAALTSAADSCVLGSRLTAAGWSWAGYALLAIGALAWAWLTANVLRHWDDHPSGAGFLLTVATESVALLALVLGATWLAWAGAVLVPLGIVLYAFVLWHFEPRELCRDAGDHWIAGGGLAIAAFGLAELSKAHAVGVHDAASTAALVVWAAALAWIPPLVVAELAWPRPYYDVRRWATVFPLGMYAVASDAVGDARGAGGIVAFGHAFVWVAVAAWALIAAAGLRRTAARVRSMT